jgi:hypothetical protein
LIELDLRKVCGLYSSSDLYIPLQIYRIGGAIVRVLASSAIDHGFEPRSGKSKDYEIDVCCFSAIKHASLRRKNKDWLARNQNNLLFQWASTIKTNSACWSSTMLISSSSHRKLTCSRHYNSWIIAEFALNNSHSLTPLQIKLSFKKILKLNFFFFFRTKISPQKNFSQNSTKARDD